MNWFWDTMWKWFGERDPPPPPPVPKDENMTGLGWRGDRSDGGADIRTRHENINWKHCDDD